MTSPYGCKVFYYTISLPDWFAVRTSGFYPIYRKRPVRFRIPVYTRLSVSLRLPALLQYVPPPLRTPSGTGNRQHSTLDTFPVSPGALQIYPTVQHSSGTLLKTIVPTTHKVTDPPAAG
jgi:hypothetical protein